VRWKFSSTLKWSRSLAPSIHPPDLGGLTYFLPPTSLSGNTVRDASRSRAEQYIGTDWNATSSFVCRTYTLSRGRV